jgi:hypothetical protein
MSIDNTLGIGENLITKEILDEVKKILFNMGFENFEFKILSESAHVIIHLRPYDVVVRMALNSGQNIETDQVMARELHLANFLDDHGIPVIASKLNIPSGPYKLEDHCFSLWPYYPYSKDQTMTPRQAINYLKVLSEALKDYPMDLPELGVWKRARLSANNLKSNKEAILRGLLNDFETVDTWMGQVKSVDLVSSHGDGHIKNLYPSRGKWLWTDFEDASKMPKYWDLASLLANSVLFNGFESELYKEALRTTSISDVQSFYHCLQARILMSIIGNLDFALRGMGDMDYVNLQLQKYDGFERALKLLRRDHENRES